MVGDIVTLTIRVDAGGAEPIRVVNPVLSGFELRGTSEATRVSITPEGNTRTFTRELRLATTRAGTASVGPVRVRQGETVVETAPISVKSREW